VVRAEIKISCAKSGFLNALYAALKPESQPTPRHRSRVEVIYESPLTLRVIIHSRDISSLRASLNMMLRVLGTVCDTTSVVSQLYPCTQL